MQQQQPQQFNYLFKYIIIGDTGVGKSSLLLQFLQDKFKERHEITVGVEFGSKNIQAKDKTIKLQIWDTAGQEDFRSITRSYYRSAAGAIIVYDVTSWIQEARSNGNPQMSFILVGNKADLEDQRQVSKLEGEAFAEENGITFLESSAKSKQNIQEIFVKTAEDIIQKIENGSIDENDNSYGVKVGNLNQQNNKQQQKSDKIQVQNDKNEQKKEESNNFANCNC